MVYNGSLYGQILIETFHFIAMRVKRKRETDRTFLWYVVHRLFSTKPLKFRSVLAPTFKHSQVKKLGDMSTHYERSKYRRIDQKILQKIFDFDILDSMK